MPNQRQKAAPNSYGAILATALSDLDISGGPCRAFITGSAGNLKVTTAAGTSPTFAVQANTLYPIACTRLWATGSTATVICVLA